MTDHSHIRIACGSAVALLCASTLLAQAKTDDWQVWRGPDGNGIAEAQQEPVTEWDENTNVVWKAKVPGRGHSSPTVVNNKIFLTTAYEVEQRQTVLCFDRKTGKQLWETEINKGNFDKRIHPSNTHASPTVSSDGKRLFAVFNNNQSAQLAALDLDGKILWQKTAGVFKPKMYKFGYGASPLVYDGMVIVACECERDGTMKAFDVNNGSEIWSVKRDKATSYSSPIVANIGGKKQLIMSGAKSVTAYSPKDGSQLWTCDAPWTVTCGTAVWDEKLNQVFVSGGYPTPRTMAVKADGSGKLVWEHRVKCYEQSMLCVNGHVYCIDDGGIIRCYDAKKGTEKWRQRTDGKPVSSSPILVGDNIYVANERGTTFVFKANPEKFEKVAENQLGESTYATPAFCDSMIYTRVATGSRRNRKEFLYCIGKNGGGNSLQGNEE